jgi:hypothetical protein
MKLNMPALRIGLSLAVTIAVINPVTANSYRETGKTVTVANSMITVTPSRDWNSLSVKLGKNAETWTLDGENLNNVTFFGAIAPGMPLYKERNKKREPLPKMRKDTLLVDIPELLEGTIRAYNSIAIFSITSSEPAKFLGKDGIRFSYKYVDNDELPRLGEAVGTIIDGKLYMASFDAPRLNYYDRVLNDYRALVSTANLK